MKIEEVIIMKKALCTILAIVLITSNLFLISFAFDADNTTKLADQTLKDFILTEDESKSLSVAIWFYDSKTSSEYAAMSRNEKREYIKAANEANVALIKSIVSSYEADSLTTVVYAEVTPSQLKSVIALDEVLWIDFLDMSEPVAEDVSSDKAADETVKEFVESEDDSKTLSVAIWFKTEKDTAGMSPDEAREYIKSENEKSMSLIQKNVISCEADNMLAVIYAYVKPSGLKAILGFDEVRWVDYYDRQMTPETDGDVNLDGKLDAGDARMVLRYSAKLESITDLQKSRIDMDGNNKINAADARIILRRSAKLFDAAGGDV